MAGPRFSGGVPLTVGDESDQSFDPTNPFNSAGPTDAEIARIMPTLARASQPPAGGPRFKGGTPLEDDKALPPNLYATYDPKEFETTLTPEQEARFQRFIREAAPQDPNYDEHGRFTHGYDYDYRGAYLAGQYPAAPGEHWKDTFKKPIHETFSNESKYAKGKWASLAGKWDGDTFVAPQDSAWQVIVNKAKNRNKRDAGDFGQVINAGRQAYRDIALTTKAAGWAAGPVSSDELADAIVAHGKEALPEGENTRAFREEDEQAQKDWDQAKSTRDRLASAGRTLFNYAINAKGAVNSLVAGVIGLGGFVGSMKAGAGAGAALGALEGPQGAAAGAALGGLTGAGTYAGFEAAGGTVLQMLAKAGVPLDDRAAIKAALDNPEFQAAARKQAELRGVTQAVVQTVTLHGAGMISSAAERAFNAKTAKTLTEKGYNAGNPLEVQWAMRDPEIRAALQPEIEKFVTANRATKAGGFAALTGGFTGAEMVDKTQSGEEVSGADVIGSLIRNGAFGAALMLPGVVHTQSKATLRDAFQAHQKVAGSVEDILSGKATGEARAGAPALLGAPEARAPAGPEAIAAPRFAGDSQGNVGTETQLDAVRRDVETRAAALEKAGDTEGAIALRRSALTPELTPQPADVPPTPEPAAPLALPGPRFVGSPSGTVATETQLDAERRAKSERFQAAMVEADAAERAGDPERALQIRRDAVAPELAPEAATEAPPATAPATAPEITAPAEPPEHPLVVDLEQQRAAQISPEGQAAIAAMPAAERARLMPKGLNDMRILRPVFRNDLGAMAGELLSKKEGNLDYVTDDYGVILRRLPSFNPDWFKAMSEDSSLAMTVPHLRKTVEKALNGEKLGVRQARVIEFMLDHLSDIRRMGSEMELARSQLAEARQARREAAGNLLPLRAYGETPAADAARMAGPEHTAVPPTITAYERDIANAGELYEEDAYNPEWDAETRSLSELYREARDIDEDAADAIADSSRSDLESAREWAKIIIGRQQKEAANATQQDEPGAHGSSREAGARGREERLPAEAPTAPERTALELEAQTPDDLKAAQARAEAAKKAEAEAEKKAQVDAERGEFTLAGSDHEADQAAARGQQDLLSQPERAPPAADAPSEETLAARKKFAAHKAELQAARNNLIEAFRSQGFLEAVSRRDPSKRIILTFDMSGEGRYRVTSFDNGEPTGHRVYNHLGDEPGAPAIDGAVSEFTGYKPLSTEQSEAESSQRIRDIFSPLTIKDVPPAFIRRHQVEVEQLVDGKVSKVTVSAKEALQDLARETAAFKKLRDCVSK